MENNPPVDPAIELNVIGKHALPSIQRLYNYIDNKAIIGVPLKQDSRWI
jgi:hypothetical protein